MKTLALSSRAILGLAVAGAALLSAPAASAQTLPYYSFNVTNLTQTLGDPVYSVYDSLTFGSVQVNESFADGFMQSIGLPNVETQDAQTSSAQLFTASNGSYSDPIHGLLTSAVLSGTLAFPGIAPDGSGKLDLQILTDPNGTVTSQSVFTPFTASLLGSNPTGIAAGTFSLRDLAGTSVKSVNIILSPAAAPVPEASTTVSMGLLLALGLGGVAVARRKRVAAPSASK